MSGSDAALLEVSALEVVVRRPEGDATVLDGVDLVLAAGDRVGLVGESGSGKTMLGLSLLRLLPPGVLITGGSIRVGGRDLVGLTERELCAVRGRGVAMVFQDPLTGLDPLRTVGSLLVEAARRAGRGRAQARRRALECLALVGVPAPAERLRAYPHQLSGGLRQRVMIALALVNEPALLIADEPTTALDATIQAQVLDLLRKVTSGRAVVLVTHDLGVAAEVCDRIVVLYGGRVLEDGPTDEVLRRPAHPYTEGLLACRPRLGASGERRLQPIGGAPPRLGEVPPGCAFVTRCGRAQPLCSTRPLLAPVAGRRVACWYPSRDDEDEPVRPPAGGSPASGTGQGEVGGASSPTAGGAGAT